MRRVSDGRPSSKSSKVLHVSSCLRHSERTRTTVRWSSIKRWLPVRSSKLSHMKPRPVRRGSCDVGLNLQVNPKGARMKRARNGLFFSICKPFEKTNVFSRCTYRLWFRYVRQLALHVRFPNESHVGQEHAPTETSRPLSLGPDPSCGRLQSFGAARPLLRLSLGLGPTVLGHSYIPRLQSEGLIGTRFAMAFMYSLSSANTSELSSS